MSVEVTVSLRVRDMLHLIERRYGSLRDLRAHIDRHPDDTVALGLWVTARQHAREPDLEVRLTELVLGDPADILAFNKLQLLGYLLGHSGVGLRELARGLGKNPATVLEQVEDLETAGLLVKESHGPGKPATIRPLIQELTIRLAPHPRA